MNNLRLDWQKCGNCWGQTQGQSLNFPFLWGHLCGCCVFAARCIFKLNALACKGETMHKTYPGMLLPSLVEFRYTKGVRSGKASSPRLIGEGLSGLFLGLQYMFCAALQIQLTPKKPTFSGLMSVSREVPSTQCSYSPSIHCLSMEKWTESDWLLGCLLIECPFLTSSTFFSSSQPSLLSAEPLLPPHNFHSHSLRRLPLYQPLHISGPMPASLSVGQPTLPPLPAHHRVPLAGASLSPTQVPPFLSLPRRQPSYGLDQVCVILVCVFWLRRK